MEVDQADRANSGKVLISEVAKEISTAGDVRLSLGFGTANAERGFDFAIGLTSRVVVADFLTVFGFTVWGQVMGHPQ
jgi:hypothetical protein